MNIIIAGAGNFAREVEGWLALSGAKIGGFIADDEPGVRGTIRDYERQGDEEVIVAISDPKGRKHVVETLTARGAVFHGLTKHVHSPTAHIGGGCILCPLSLVSAGAHVGDFVIVNVMTSVGHDVRLGSYVTLSSHVDLCGHVELGDGVLVGSGARVLPGVKIGAYSIIGAGAVVMRDVSPGQTVFQQPARVL